MEAQTLRDELKCINSRSIRVHWDRKNKRKECVFLDEYLSKLWTDDQINAAKKKNRLWLIE